VPMKAAVAARAGWRALLTLVWDMLAPDTHLIYPSFIGSHKTLVKFQVIIQRINLANSSTVPCALISPAF
jgi:hypothetical protein